MTVESRRDTEPQADGARRRPSDLDDDGYLTLRGLQSVMTYDGLRGHLTRVLPQRAQLRDIDWTSLTMEDLRANRDGVLAWMVQFLPRELYLRVLTDVYERSAGFGGTTEGLPRAAGQ